MEYTTGRRIISALSREHIERMEAQKKVKWDRIYHRAPDGIYYHVPVDLDAEANGPGSLDYIRPDLKDPLSPGYLEINSWNQDGWWENASWTASLSWHDHTEFARTVGQATVFRCKDGLWSGRLNYGWAPFRNVAWAEPPRWLQNPLPTALAGMAAVDRLVLPLPPQLILLEDWTAL
jgi:hypothetical protein